MGVALENARLFDETKRLPVRDERAGRRAGADQRRPARPRPEARPAVDVRPRRRQDPGDLRRSDRRHRGRRAASTTRSASCTRSSAASAFPEEPMPIIGPRRHVIETRKPLVFNRDVQTQVARLGPGAGDDVRASSPCRRSGRRSSSADEVRGIISLQNIDREDAFSESDVELLTTLAASLSVALENVRLIDETRQRLAELATVNEVGQALSEPARPRRAHRAGRRADARRRSRPTSATSHSTTRAAT